MQFWLLLFFLTLISAAIVNWATEWPGVLAYGLAGTSLIFLAFASQASIPK